MARTIQIKRGLEKNLPTLKPGEQAFTTDTRKVFIGSDTGNVDITNSVDTTKLATKTELGTVTAALAEKATEELYHLYVGKNQKYKTITEAFNEWKNPTTINKKPSVIHIYKGVYNEKIGEYGQSDISFIGENKHDVIWKTTTGYYRDAPLVIQGNVNIKGITFIADHSDNPDYTYIPFAATNTSGGAYAVHIDQAGVTGKTVIEDCTLISYQNAALGAGTRKNQEIELINTEICNYATWPEPVNNGAWLYHTSATIGDTNQKVKAKGCKFHSSAGRAIEFQSYNTDAEPIPLEIMDCRLSSDTITDHEQLVRFGVGAGATKNKIIPTANSFGNNVNSLNNQKMVQWAKLTDYDGKCLLTNDFNNVWSGFFMGNGADGALNTPTKAWYIGEAISYKNDQFIVQYAWSIVDGFKKYKRSKNTSTWSSWEFCVENLAGINNYLSIAESSHGVTVTDLNVAIKSGYYQCAPNAANAPSNVAFHVHTISSSSQFKIQYAWQMSDGAKFKRVMVSNTWGSWKAIVE